MFNYFFTKYIRTYGVQTFYYDGLPSLKIKNKIQKEKCVDFE